jgi:hypothetical protein
MSARGNALRRTMRAEAERLGARGVRFERGTKHCRMFITLLTGQERFLVVSMSPSDSLRGTKNAIGQLRRMLCGRG